MPRPGHLLLLLLLLLPPSPSPAAEDKDRLVRTTEALTPEQERQGFHLPEGFSIQLFADESQLGGKPINMAFDVRGRLWVSSTREYPYAVPKIRWSDPQDTRAKDSKDTIRILEDTDGDGRADKVTVFADELNIPTGVLPYKNGCIAWSIPNIWFFEDTDGDGKCDKRRILFGPLGYERDTHGMISSLRLGLDGWVYATHGFSNTSHFEVLPHNRDQKTLDLKPETLDITSGSVFRFKPDGSRVELWTSGQVNPFGLCWDSWGNLYSADCHSNPIYQLIRGACYPSFGKPDDGLGFAPVMCAHAHGSTGLCGIIYLDGGVWGPEWDDHMFVGNCVTSRVNHDHITFTGSTPKANEATDFLTSDDPWFRPVDLQLGPDSALYVADFYNKVIGHYEVPLDHPGRDKDRGRIWRVVREGFTGKLTDCDFPKLTVNQGVKELGSGNLTRRHLVAEALTDKGPDVWPDLESATFGKDSSHTAMAHTAWIALRLGKVGVTFLERLRDIETEPNPPARDRSISRSQIKLDDGSIVDVISGRPSFIAQHIMRLLATGQGEPGVPNSYQFFQWVYAAPPSSLTGPRLASHSERLISNPLYHTARIDALGRSEDPAATLGVLQFYHRVGVDDPVSKHTARMALRNLLLLKRSFDSLQVDEMPSDLAEEVARVVVAVPTPDAANWLLRWLNHSGDGGAADMTLRLRAMTQIAHLLPASHDAELVALTRKHFGDDLDTQLDLFSAIREGRQSQKGNVSQPLAAWSAELTKRLLVALKSEPANTWRPITPPTEASPNPWQPTSRKCAGGEVRTFLDSHVVPGSEKFSGTLRSAPFALPAKLTFWIAGHRGFPTAEPHDKNFVRLVDTETGEELARAYPPRHDVAQQITWTFDPTEQGTRGREHTVLELIDGDNATAYAWLAAGGFDPAVVTIPHDALQRDKRIRMLAQLCSTGSLPVISESNHGQAARDTHRLATDATAFLSNLPNKAGFTPDTRAALADFLAARSSDSAALLLAPLARDAELAPVVLGALQDPQTTSDQLASAFRTQPFRAQAKLATALAGSVSGANQLLKLAPPAVLAEPLVSSKLNALDDGKIAQRLKTLTASLPPQNEALNKLIAQRLQSFVSANADVARGEQVFTTVCFICHRIGVRGNLVGPQLDGIGARGIERLLEDILDPNRSVDPAFRLHLVKRMDGTLYAGLQRREEADALVFADATAQETRIPKSDIAGNEESTFSLMPPGLGELLTKQQLDDLLAYLLARK